MGLPRRKRLRLERSRVCGNRSRLFRDHRDGSAKSHLRGRRFRRLSASRLLNQRCAETATRCYAVLPDARSRSLAPRHGRSSAVVRACRIAGSRCAPLRASGGHNRVASGSEVFDRALRDNEPLNETAHYILANPIRAGLATRVGEYPLAGSLGFGCDSSGRQAPPLRRRGKIFATSRAVGAALTAARVGHGIAEAGGGKPRPYGGLRRPPPSRTFSIHARFRTARSRINRGSRMPCGCLG